MELLVWIDTEHNLKLIMTVETLTPEELFAAVGSVELQRSQKQYLKWMRYYWQWSYFFPDPLAETELPTS